MSYIVRTITILPHKVSCRYNLPVNMSFFLERTRLRDCGRERVVGLMMFVIWKILKL